MTWISLLLEIAQQKGKKGLVVLSSKKKMGFLSDPKYMGYKGFQTADTAEPYFELMYLPFEGGAPLPRWTLPFRNTSPSSSLSFSQFFLDMT